MVNGQVLTIITELWKLHYQYVMVCVWGQH